MFFILMLYASFVDIFYMPCLTKHSNGNLGDFPNSKFFHTSLEPDDSEDVISLPRMFSSLHFALSSLNFSLNHILTTNAYVLVSYYGCYNKTPQTGWLIL